MKRFVNRKGLAGIASVSALVASLLVGAVGVGHGITDSHAASREAKFKNYSGFVQYTAKHHKAPFFSHELASQEAMQTYAKKMQQNFHALKPLTNGNDKEKEKEGNVKVTQDYNPWPKADVAGAINPKNGQNYVIQHDDFRMNFDHQFYNVSSNGGKNWYDEVLADVIDPVTQSSYSVQTDPGVAFDTFGNTYFSSLETNTVSDTTALSSSSGYFNYDTAVTVVQGFNNGKYSSVIPRVVDYVACNQSSCVGSLDAPRVTVDTNIGSSTKGAVYVYYTYFCNGAGASGNDPCTDTYNPSISIPAGTSAILVRQSFDQGMTFSPPIVISGPLLQGQFPDMVIDHNGGPHIFFVDFSHNTTNNAPTSTIVMYEASQFNGSWSVNTTTPVASFEYNGLNNLHWNFRDIGTVAPGCSNFHDTAYCAFSAWQVGTGPLSSSPNVYVAAVNTQTGDSQIYRVNNDNFSSNKAHFFPWATTDTKGNVYVGWYDNRNDPNDARVQYFVGKSSNGGRSFSKQQAVSNTSFNHCVGFPNCSFFGDYYQLVAGNDDVVHAAWADTRDGATMQIYTQDIKWK
jgi:hypothetical protein